VIARASLEVLRGLGLSNVHVGMGRTAIVAEVAAVSGIGNRESGIDGSRGRFDSRFPIPDSRPSLGSLPPSILEPDPHLAALLDGIGVETCAELAALAGESVEVRLGAEGVRLWKLARGDDDRLIFAPIPRALPHASLEWSDYALTDTERLLFSVNALLGTVCEKLVERGSLAREMTLTLALASGDAVNGAMVMAAFGLGTLPTLLTAGFAAQKLAALRRHPWIRYPAAAAIIAMGIVGLARVPGLQDAVIAGWHCVA